MQAHIHKLRQQSLSLICIKHMHNSLLSGNFHPFCIPAWPTQGRNAPEPIEEEAVPPHHRAHDTTHTSRHQRKPHKIYIFSSYLFFKPVTEIYYLLVKAKFREETVVCSALLRIISSLLERFCTLTMNIYGLSCHALATAPAGCGEKKKSTNTQIKIEVFREYC